MSLRFRKNDPRRPVDWRWQRAGELVEASARPARSLDDRYILKAMRFRQQLDRVHSDTGHLQLLAAEPALYEAWNIQQDDSGEQNYRWELEARLLAGVPCEEIADKMRMTADIVRMYELLFFNVSDCLTSPSYITNVVLGKSVQAGLSERQYDCLWKMYGYWGGPFVLDSLVYRFNAPARPSEAGQVGAFWRDDVRDQLPLKAAIAMRTMSVNWQTQVEIMNLYMRMLEMEANNQRGAGGGSSEAILVNVKAFLERVPWCCKRNTDRVVESESVVARFDKIGVSLRAEHLAFASAGQLSPALQDLLECAHFPEPVNNDSEAQASG